MLTPEIIKSRIRKKIIFITEIDGKIVGTVSGMEERKSFCVKTLGSISIIETRELADDL